MLEDGTILGHEESDGRRSLFHFTVFSFGINEVGSSLKLALKFGLYGVRPARFGGAAV